MNYTNAYSVLITVIPGGSQPVISNGETVAELFEKAFRGQSIDGFQIQVNGENKDYNYIPRAGESVTCARQVKGNR